MTWYLVYRSLAVVAFVLAIAAGFTTINEFSERRETRGWWALVATVALAVGGSLLVGLGWNGIR